MLKVASYGYFLNSRLLLLFYFHLYIYLPDSHKSVGGAIHSDGLKKGIGARKVGATF